MKHSAEPRDRINPLRVFVNAKERQAIQDRAKMTGMTVSAFLRAAAIGVPIKSVLDLEAIKVLSILHRDQVQLANLLREVPGPEARQIILRIGTVQDELVRTAKKVRT
jgi:hypothetical protein